VIGGATPAAITGTAITGTSFATSGDMTFGDNDKAIFGAGSDLQIYHDGSHSYVSDEGTGSLRLRGVDIQVQNTAGVNAAKFISNADVQLFYAGSQKLATTSTGVDVTGTANVDVLTQTNGAGTLTLKDLGGSSSEIEASGTLHIDFQGSNFEINTNDTARFNISSGGDISFYEDTGTTPKFFWDASAESLGIGTTVPTAMVDISKSGTGDYSTFRLSNTGASGRKYELGLGGNTAGADYANKLYFRDSTAGSNRMVIDSSGNVGIGTSSPSGSLHISRSDDARLKLTDTGDSCTFTVRSDGVNTSIGTDTAHPVRFMTNNTERMRIDSSGNLLVGTASTNPTGLNVEGITLEGQRIHVSRDGNPSLFLNRKTSDGDIAEFRKDGTTVGSISSRGGVATNLILRTATGQGAGIGGANSGVLPCDEDGLQDDEINLGASGTRWKDLYLSGGVYLGGTGSANKLDDYESGDIDISTMYFENSGSAVTNTAYDTLRYVKIGSQVTITGNIYFDSVTSQVGALKIPLPFANGTGEKFRTVGIIGNFQTSTTTVVKIDSGQSFGLMVYPNLWAAVTVAADQTYVVNVTYNT